MEKTLVNRSETLKNNPDWVELKKAVTAIQAMQNADGSIPVETDLNQADQEITIIIDSIKNLSKFFSHDDEYLKTVVKDLESWRENRYNVPDFLNSILVFNPAGMRENGLQHLVVFPMYTQNGSQKRHLEALIVEVMWPEYIATAERTYTNKLFVPLKFIDYTSGYNTNSAVLFPETVAMRETPAFTWGAIFQDREAARFRKVLTEAINITSLELPEDAKELLDSQDTTQNTFILWDLIHDRTHMSGDLPFDPFMIKQRMPYFLYGLEELRCDLTAFRECVKLARNVKANKELKHYATLVQYAIIFDRIFRFSVTGSRVRNYDGMAGQLLFAWMHQHNVLHWTDNKLSIDWEKVPEIVSALGDEIDHLYWASIDRPKINHWLAAYDLVTKTLTPNVASVWAEGKDKLPLTSSPKEITDTLLDDEFPLSMFFEAYSKKIQPTIDEIAKG